MAEMSPLRRRMIEDMTVRNLSPATQRSYVHAVAKFSRYFGRSPDRLGLEDVRAFQVHLVATGISWPALNQTVCALRFFYGVTLGQAEIAGADRLCARAAQAAGGAERRRGRALPRGGAEPEDAHRADHGLCRGAARLGGRRPQGRRHRQRPRWSSGSSTARAARTATSCCRRSCCGILRVYWRLARAAALAVSRP